MINIAASINLTNMIAFMMEAIKANDFDAYHVVDNKIYYYDPLLPLKERDGEGKLEIIVHTDQLNVEFKFWLTTSDSVPSDVETDYENNCLDSTATAPISVDFRAGEYLDLLIDKHWITSHRYADENTLFNSRPKTTVITQAGEIRGKTIKQQISTFVKGFIVEYGPDELYWWLQEFIHDNGIRLPDVMYQGEPEQMDLENNEVMEITDDYIKFCGGGDWQPAITVKITFEDGQFTATKICDGYCKEGDEMTQEQMMKVLDVKTEM